MAESMEETDTKTDVDLTVDRNDFRKIQFDVFKHNFLDSFDEAGYETLEHLTLNPTIKKDVVNMARRLQKAKISLDSLKSEDRQCIDPVIGKMDEVFAQLIELSKQSSEYSTRNLKLPEFSRQDVESLLGKTEKQLEDGSDQQDQDPVKMLCKSNEEYERKITELLGAGELLMNEWHEIKQYIKRFND